MPNINPTMRALDACPQTSLGAVAASEPTSRRVASKKVAKSAMLAATFVCLPSWLSACGDSKPAANKFASIDITGATYARGFNLKDTEGRTRQLEEFRGKVVVVFFGFVQCPDVCPTKLAALAEVKKRLGKHGERLQTVFVTVDPERDTADVLRSYMANFDANVVALIPSAAELEAIAKEFKVYYKKVPGQTPTSYTMDHTANAYVFDPSGRVRLVTRYGMPVASMVADIEQLIKS